MRRSPILLLLTVLLAPGAIAQVRARQVDPQIDRYFQLARAEYSGERAREVVAFMSGKSRWPGNTAFDASLDLVIARLRAFARGLRRFLQVVTFINFRSNFQSVVIGRCLHDLPEAGCFLW